MSETVTNAEVEDVLSSIRRLVSEDRKPAQKVPEKPSIEDKLVLTPSLRVSNDTPVAAQPKGAPPQMHEVAQQRSASYQEAMQEIDSGEEEEPSASDRNQVAEDFKFISGREPRFRAQFSTPTGDDHLQDTAEPSRKLAFSAPRAAAYSADMLNLGTSELVEDVPPTPDRLSAKIAALETAISRIPENWEPDEPGKSDYSGSEDPAMAWEDDVEFDATGALVSDTLKEPDYDAPQDGSVGWSDTTASSAEPEERIVDSPFAARVTAADAAVEDTTDEPTTAAQHDDAAPFGADEYLDEEMLRDLVSEIVRSELQGALGERITRNVRKLVRREIHRALTSQDLE